MTLAKTVVRSLTPAARSFRADVRRFGHVINKDGVLGTHSRDERRSIAQSPLEAVGSLSELKLLSWLCLQTRFRQILEGARIVDRLVAKLLQRFSGERRAPA